MSLLIAYSTLIRLSLIIKFNASGQKYHCDRFKQGDRLGNSQILSQQTRLEHHYGCPQHLAWIKDQNRDTSCLSSCLYTSLKT